MKHFSFDIDVLGVCNLSCPSCPQGNITDYRLSGSPMEPRLLREIMVKAQSECHVNGIGLFNWAEPLLHPRLPELIRIVEERGICCFLSSNLNVARNMDEIMAANPFSFRISVSGFTQETYGRTHRGGDIETVRKHMTELIEAKRRHNAGTHIYVYYHRYRHNLEEEQLMRDFASSLGIGFEPVWALMFPLEKVLAFAGEAQDFPITEEDLKIMDELALPLHEALSICRGYREQACALREAQISLDCRGNIQLCCGIFDARRYTLGNYLDLSLDTIQKLRHAHPLCSRCMERGAHVYMNFTHVHTTRGAHILEKTAIEHVAPEDVKRLGLRYEMRLKMLRRFFEMIYQRALSGIITTRQKAFLGRQFERIQRSIGKVLRTSS